MASQKILITGATGFLGTNLQAYLATRFPGKYEIYAYNSKSNPQELDAYTKDCAFIFHFAAVHRPKDVSEFTQVNVELFEYLLQKLQEHGNTCPVLYTSSIQAGSDTPYGRSKTAAEAALNLYAEKTGAKRYICRLTNTFGSGARPNGHSVVATFCYNIARNLPISISDRNHVMRFYYIDDVMDMFLNVLAGNADENMDDIVLSEDKIYTVTLGELADRIMLFQESRAACRPAVLKDAFDKCLYKTFVSYCEE